MALILSDRVQETSTTTGAGTYTLLGATTGFRPFSVIGTGNTCYYLAEDGASWEVGVGTYTATGTTLARTEILYSSNADAAVNWAAGTRTISMVSPARILGPSARRFVAGMYYGHSIEHTTAGTSATSTNKVRVGPFTVAETTTFDRITLGVTTGAVGSTYRLGAWSFDGTLVLDAGTIDGNSATVQEITISLTLTPNQYLIGGVAQGGNPNVNTLNFTGIGTSLMGHPAYIASGALGYDAGSMSGALTNITINSSTAISTILPRIMLRAQ